MMGRWRTKGRCYRCSGRFGLIRHYYGFRKFCSSRCLNHFKKELWAELDRRRFVGWLYSKPG